ncbi:unnamed protein product [Polarella glacialis]|uniref:Uncharacterized protein n=1 Tax=Polarella glacialis TaxID=89957 RepID=A0A813HRZ2_POLGL|nr:unnamed protein product [Polarella glacialis]CAE8680980.1 unnamed protein product [Polarella glacialis]
MPKPSGATSTWELSQTTTTTMGVCLCTMLQIEATRRRTESWSMQRRTFNRATQA